MAFRSRHSEIPPLGAPKLRREVAPDGVSSESDESASEVLVVLARIAEEADELGKLRQRGHQRSVHSARLSHIQLRGKIEKPTRHAFAPLRPQHIALSRINHGLIGARTPRHRRPALAPICPTAPSRASGARFFSRAGSSWTRCRVRPRPRRIRARRIRYLPSSSSSRPITTTTAIRSNGTARRCRPIRSPACTASPRTRGSARRWALEWRSKSTPMTRPTAASCRAGSFAI